MDETLSTVNNLGLPLKVGKVDFDQAVLTYDYESDTLMLHLTGRGQPGISVVVDDHLYARLDRERTKVIGLQIEGFLASVARKRPELLDALDVAELRGISLEEVARLRRAWATEQRKRTAIDEVVSQFAGTSDESGSRGVEESRRRT